MRIFNLFKKRINSYVLTGSDEIELNNIFRKKGIKKYFKLILGSPVNKFKNFNKFSKHVNTKVPNYYFGDSRLDYQVAKKLISILYLLNSLVISLY